MNNAEAIEILERAKHDHYSEPEGLSSCDSLCSFQGQCSCGADQINAEIDRVIAHLKQQFSDVLGSSAYGTGAYLEVRENG